MACCIDAGKVCHLLNGGIFYNCRFEISIKLITTSLWLSHPFQKYARQNRNLPQIRVRNKNIFELPPPKQWYTNHPTEYSTCRCMQPCSTNPPEKPNSPARTNRRLRGLWTWREAKISRNCPSAWATSSCRGLTVALDSRCQLETGSYKIATEII